MTAAMPAPAPTLARIDWSQPWLAPYRAVGEPLAQRIQAGSAGWEALNSAPVPVPVRFVPQQALPPGLAYEQFIFETAQVPTREGLHDFFNGLIWLHFPRTKGLLNRLQAAEIARAGVGPVRGAVRDAITVFDENAALLQAPPALWQALQARQWSQLFGALRPLWAQARLLLFGHALLEKLVAPYKAITAHVWPLAQEVPPAVADWDAWLAQELSAPRLAAKPFVPLPVLGVPGWWAPNADPGFYADERVFRPPRTAGAGG